MKNSNIYKPRVIYADVLTSQKRNVVLTVYRIEFSPLKNICESKHAAF